MLVHVKQQGGIYAYNIQLVAAVVNGHVPPPSRIIFAGKKLRHELLRRHPPLSVGTLLSVLCKDDIVLVQHARCPDGHGLLAGTHHVKGQAALPLGIKHDDVEDGDEEHVLVQLDDSLLGNVRLKRGVHNGAMLVDHPVGGQGRPVLRVFELELICEGALESTGELHVIGVRALGDAAG